MIKELTSIRILLMLMIFIHHINTSYNGGYPAVAGFFVLGGFVMTLGYKQKVESLDFSYSSYLFKRLLRIYPMHWICLFMMLIVMLLKGGEINLSINTLVLNALLLQSWVPEMNVYFSYNSLSWYCSSLILFIAFFPLFIRYITNLSSKYKIILWSIIISLYVVMWSVFPARWHHPVLYVNPVMRLYDSLVGVGGALLVLHIKDNEKLLESITSRKILQLLSIVGIIMLVLLSLCLSGMWKSFSLVYWIPIIIVICSLTLLNYSQKNNILSLIITSKPILWMGRCSFSFYMIHALVIRFMTSYTIKYIPFCDNILVRATILFIISFCLAQILYTIVEVKLTQKLNNLITKYSNI